jgi:hypothetical protein
MMGWSPSRFCERLCRREVVKVFLCFVWKALGIGYGGACS